MRLLLTAMTALLLTVSAHGQGIPFIRNFLVDDFHANNINFDIETDQYGNVFVANFEGLMFYDHAEWRIIHTPEITRVTVVFRASDNTIWVGGYNYFGKVVRKPNGDITLKRVGNPNLFRGEVLEIYERQGEIFFVTSDNIYGVSDGQVTVRQSVPSDLAKVGVLDVLNVGALEKGEQNVVRNDTVLVEPLYGGMKAIVLKNEGIVIADEQNRTLLTINDANGLCSDDVSYASYDGHGHLWCSTGRGIFVIQLPAAISRYTANEGLQGTILSINSLGGTIYAGTTEGLYRLVGQQFHRVPEVSYACWELTASGNSLLAATADGIYRILPGGSIRHLTRANAMTLLDEGDRLYSGETDGVYLMQADGAQRRRLCSMNNVRKLYKDREGTIWAQSLYGAVLYKKEADGMFKNFEQGDNAIHTIVMMDGRASIINAEDTVPVPYPLLSYADDENVTWLTDN